MASANEHRLERADFTDPTETLVFVRHVELGRGTEVWLVHAPDRPLGWRVERIHVFDWPPYARTLPESRRREAVAERALSELALSGATWEAILAAAERSVRSEGLNANIAA